jgi:hypothetical protein
MDELSVDLERTHQEITGLIRQILKVLASFDRKSAPEKYLAAIRGIRTVKEIWARHIVIERALLSRMSSCDLYVPAGLDRIAEENASIEKLLASLLVAPWPRSAHAGLHSIRTRATEVLTQVLKQVERERAAILPGMLLSKHIGVTGAHADSAASELVTNGLLR